MKATFTNEVIVVTAGQSWRSSYYNNSGWSIGQGNGLSCLAITIITISAIIAADRAYRAKYGVANTFDEIFHSSWVDDNGMIATIEHLERLIFYINVFFTECNK